MYTSKYTMHFDSKENGGIILMNTLSGAMDIVQNDVIGILSKVRNGKDLGEEYRDVIEHLKLRKYIYDSKDEEDLLISQMNEKLTHDFMKAPENFIISTTYTCNMACTYCFQSRLPPDRPKVIESAKIKKAFEYIDMTHSERGAEVKPVITVYGGEPLQEGEEYSQAVSEILEAAQDRDIQVIIITNGLYLDHYVDNLLCDYDNIKEVHVTLDGMEVVHNRRRPMKNNGNSFQRVIGGIENALNNAIKINLRFVADYDNVDALPDLVDFMVEKGWDQMPHFTPHMGRICCGCPGEYTHNIMTTDQIATKLLQFYEKNEDVARLIPTRCMGMDQISSTGKPYPPIFSACPGAKIEYAMDAYGDLFPCSAAMGKQEFKIGTYYPEISHNENFEKWRARDIFANETCSNCKSALQCGGGCPIEAYNEKGSFEESSCRPVLPTIKAGMPHFYPKLRELTEQSNTELESSNSCCS